MNCFPGISFGWLMVVATVLLPSSAVHAQENDRTELLHTQRLSKQFPDSAFLLLKEMYSKAIAGKDRQTMGICLQQMGQVCYYLGNYPKALDFHGKADKIFRETNNDEQLARNLNDMGLVYYQNRQIPVARKQYEEALSIYYKLGNREGLADTYGKIGHLYEKQKQIDSAFYFQRLALQQCRDVEQQPVVAKIYENIGSIYEDLERYDSAWYYFNRSLELYNQVNNQVASIEVINNLGDIYRKTGRYQDAIKESDQALTRAIAINDLYQKGAAYRDLGKAWNLLGQQDSAYFYIDLSRRATIDLYSIENNRQTAFLSVLFDIDKKNDEIVQLENARNITLIITTAVIIVVVLLVVLGWVTFSRQRLKIRNEQMLSERNRHIFETQKELMQVELANRQLQEDKLMEELEVKKKGLTSYTLHIIQKNQSLEDLRNKLEFLVKDDKRDQKKQLQQLIQHINQSFNHDQYWNEFRETFEQLHQPFFDNLKKHTEELTSNDLRMLSLIKLNMASKDMATLLGISQDSLRVSRYRLKKKLNLSQDESLTGFVQGL
ncbi:MULTISPECIES: tetratricopeptide repeat protein [Niastella]|uniref:Tetratricopeptide repeat protein n=1 Tax=Niastella soli TaxID=2821487 RepID=A0ABS3Z215_9BACT|nr:tetratricopeptide repeat protein [Niastella soli]MBO9204159.1 tetratricopeptide repeat protein [Niastella soli]